MSYVRERWKKNVVSSDIPETRRVSKTEPEFDGEEMDCKAN